jgi:hypothetical protein
MKGEITDKEVLYALRLGLRTALRACEHPEEDHARGALGGCGGCRAVVKIREVIERKVCSMGMDPCHRPGCPNPVVQPATGRKRKFCCNRCKQKQNRENHQQEFS